MREKLYVRARKFLIYRKDDDWSIVLYYVGNVARETCIRVMKRSCARTVAIFNVSQYRGIQF